MVGEFLVRMESALQAARKKVKVEGCFLGDFVMLVCAVLASLTAGVLVAYGVCLGMFGVFRMHARQVAVKSPVRVASGAKIVEG
jgi:hypothetical protein